ncbi:MAG TPA: ATP-binding protein, partial [bacterium]|nr:ATP-binding protein [bacterium]
EASRAGAGLGLYIAKSFMEMQKGDITVTSEKGKGTCFTLYLPKVRQEEGAKR